MSKPKVPQTRELTTDEIALFNKLREHKSWTLERHVDCEPQYDALISDGATFGVDFAWGKGKTISEAIAQALAQLESEEQEQT